MVLIGCLAFVTRCVVVKAIDGELGRVAVAGLLLDGTCGLGRSVDVGLGILGDGWLLQRDHVRLRGLDRLLFEVLEDLVVAVA